jgi:dolichol-phosphate mannosyltransferase
VEVDFMSDNQVSIICVVIPAYRVSNEILDVISSLGNEVTQIIVIDDGCPEKSGDIVVKNTKDSRVEVLFHNENFGMGAAMKTGYKRALEKGADIIIKVDGDGQMDSKSISKLIEPIKSGRAGYSKANRFYDVESLREMPKLRIIGNLALSFFAKLSTGYWQIFDPNNGFTAINSKSLSALRLERLDSGYFFQSDILFRLGLAGVDVIDVNIPAKYGAETSSLKIFKVFFEFPIKHTHHFIKRITYSYFLRDFNLASLQFLLGGFLLSFGLALGAINWVSGLLANKPTPVGTLILVAISVLSGIQLLLAFFSFDMNKNP